MVAFSSAIRKHIHSRRDRKSFGRIGEGEVGPLIRPSGTFSPRGEGLHRSLHPSFTPQAGAHLRPSTVPRRGRYSQPT